MIINISAGSKMKLDDVLSATSENGLKNKVIAAELAKKAPAYTYGTTDLTAGTSPLEEGKLYFVYE